MKGSEMIPFLPQPLKMVNVAEEEEKCHKNKKKALTMLELYTSSSS
jgi:hypothetical protein